MSVKREEKENSIVYTAVDIYANKMIQLMLKKNEKQLWVQKYKNDRFEPVLILNVNKQLVELLLMLTKDLIESW
ncbi:MAG: hypothetical protein QW290_09325 [Sulfolobales archaeon]